MGYLENETLAVCVLTATEPFLNFRWCNAPRYLPGYAFLDLWCTNHEWRKWKFSSQDSPKFSRI